MKKKMIACLFVLGFSILGRSFNVDASGIGEEEEEIFTEELLSEVFDEVELEKVLESGEIELFPFQINENEVLHFFSEQDRNDFIDERGSDVGSRSGGAPIERAKVLSTKTLKNTFLGYNSLTPNWYMASSYTISKGKSMSFSTTISDGRLSAGLSFSTSRSVAITFQANSKKASKLAATGNVKVEKVRYDRYLGNTILSSRTALRTKTPSNITHYVHYR